MRGVSGLAAVAVSVAVLLSAAATSTPAAATEGSGDHSPVREVTVPPVELRLIEEGKSLPIDLATAIALAGAKNLDILEARARYEEAQGTRNESLGGLAPAFTGSFAARRIDGRIQASFGELDDRAFSTLIPAAGVDLDLNPGHAVFDALAAHRSLAAAARDAEQVTQDVLTTVAVQYLALQEAQARVRIVEEALAASRELARVAHDRETRGAGLKVDALRAEARVAADEVRLARARNALRDASLALAVSLKLDPTVTLFPMDTTVREQTLVDPALPLAALLEQAATRRPDLAAENRRLAAAESNHRATWAGAVGPRLYGSFEESAIGRSIGDLGDRQIYGGFVGFRLSPASIGRVQAARARLDQTRLQAERVAQRIDAEVIGAREEVLTARERIEAALRGLHAAEAALDLSQVRFKGGVGIGLEVLDAQAALTESRTNLVTAIVGYNTAQIGLLRAVGGVSSSALLEQGDRHYDYNIVPH
jgi:outer membrane protein TolC